MTCIRWHGPVNAGGYGVVPGFTPTRLAHRMAWELKHGPIPEGMVIDHVWARGCRHRDCINVDHLELVTRKINSERSRSSHKMEGDQRRQYVKFQLSRVGLQ